MQTQLDPRPAQGSPAVTDRNPTAAPEAGRPRPPGSARAPATRRRPRRQWLWPLTAAVAAILVAAAAWAITHRSSPTSPGLPSPADLATIGRGSVEKSIESSGKVVSNLDVEIKCRASGEVIKLPFDVSMAVKKGELLCQLDPTDATLAVRSAQAIIEQASAKLAQAQDDLRQAEENLATTRRRDESALASAKVKAANLRAKADRQKQLLDQNLGSREDWETSETEAANADAARDSAEIAIDELKQQAIQLEYKRQAVKVADAQLQSDQVTFDTQRQQLAYTTVTAPIDGVVSALSVQKGTIVASGMSGFSGGTTIMTLSDLSHVFLMATVDESDIGEVRVGQRASIKVASFPNRIFVGKVVRIATKGVNSSNVVTFEVKVEVLDEHKDLLRPEMTGSVVVVEAEKADVLTSPAAAISRRGGQAYVTMADGKSRQVATGLEGPDMVEITSGLAAGERVVVTADLPTRWKSPDGGPPPR